ncbi:MAG: tRNA (uridine(34)/cytosine(34)/5-carboxymethylaminomethyluridine(34)-2'-O)-methyltransferase TrmL, partial [Desulfobulbaceae bacterium]|nr:tRNA (uridine(34)/cytosine(34)/5-carboxymethylaminomethyluridine(34)-2'-O)-methyltransferase TrmL [Desulfobulbaceae bacterium]
NRLHFLTTKVDRSFTSVDFRPGDFLVFGKETKGLPPEIIDLYRDRCCTIPMSNPNIRSLNLGVSAGIVLYEALRQNGFTDR